VQLIRLNSQIAPLAQSTTIGARQLELVSQQQLTAHTPSPAQTTAHSHITLVRHAQLATTGAQPLTLACQLPQPAVQESSHSLTIAQFIKPHVKHALSCITGVSPHAHVSWLLRTAGMLSHTLLTAHSHTELVLLALLTTTGVTPTTSVKEQTQTVHLLSAIHSIAHSHHPSIAHAQPVHRTHSTGTYLLRNALMQMVQLKLVENMSPVFRTAQLLIIKIVMIVQLPTSHGAILLKLACQE
jgi:hypothetical protein